MATNPPLDLTLTPINGPGRAVNAWISMFHLVFVALNPWNERSRWILEPAQRIFNTYDEADCRVAWLVGGDASDTRRLLGPRADNVLTFIDPDFSAIRAFGLSSLPAIVHLGVDGSVVNAVEGWNPEGWRTLTDELSRVLKWTQPPIPWPTDPAPFAGAPLPVTA
ncbi:MAG: hypothetical protein JO148_15985 [Acidimicrobiia bacterium]|nr:hypothetical protein [Acidimicrobiia bacterium]